MLPLKGLCAFPITPTDAAGLVDASSLGRLINRLTAANVDSIGLLGSTGVYMYLTREERRAAIEVAMERCAATPLLVGVGALRTDDALRYALDAKAIGATAGLISAASYAPLSQEEVCEHISTVARESQLPLCIYDNPGTTHFSFTTDLVERLSKLPGIIGIKNPPPSGSLRDHLSAQRAATHKGFLIGYSGDWCCAEAMIAGADTWFSVLGGVFPQTCLALTRAAQSGDDAEVERLHRVLEPVWVLFRKYASLRVVYEIVRQLDLSAAEPPRPILPVCEEAKRDVAAMLASLPRDMTE